MLKYSEGTAGEISPAVPSLAVPGGVPLPEGMLGDESGVRWGAEAVKARIDAEGSGMPAHSSRIRWKVCMSWTAP